MRRKFKLSLLAHSCVSYSHLTFLLFFIDIDVFGKCGPLECRDSMDCFFDLSANYKFYIAFENSLCNEYITEKFWRSARLPIVPIVMGGSDYSKIAPPKSYIDVNDFESVKDLSIYLQYLDANDEEYMEYFAWKKDYDLYEVPAFCQLCHKLNSPEEPEKVYKNLRQWWLYDEKNASFCNDGKDRHYYQSMVDQ